jgi:hypothetical protein
VRKWAIVIVLKSSREIFGKKAGKNQETDSNANLSFQGANQVAIRCDSEKYVTQLNIELLIEP